MDVIALGKATKAKKAIKSLNDRLGEGVEDVYTNVKTRLEELEKKDPHVTLYNRVSGVEANNAINLNKHNLHVNTILNKNKFGLTDLAFDDFADATGIDATKSTGQVFDAVGKKFVINPAATEAELVTTADSLTDIPQMITVSQVFNEQNTASGLIDLVSGTHISTEVVDGKIQLKILSSMESGLTSNICVGGVPISSGDYSTGVKSNAFDGIDTTTWMTTQASNQAGVCYIGYDFGSGNEKKIKRITIKNFSTQSNNMTSAIIQASHDGTLWDNIITKVLDNTADITNAIDMNPSSSYRYWRVMANTNLTNLSKWVVREIQMMESAIQNLYSPSGSYESPVLDIGTNFKTLQKINQVVTIPASTDITISTDTSADGITFSEYLPVNTDNTIASPSARYIKVKVDLAGGALVTPRIPMDFVAAEASNFPVNDKVIFDGSLHMKTAYSYSMNPDASFIEAGTLLRKSIDKTSYRSIEKVEVK
jgi:hypothetical protein